MPSSPEDDRLPNWSGDLQRSRLKGFERIRAIWWRRSLELYQIWKLGGQTWYWPLARELKRATAQLDLFDGKRVRQPSEIFGETPMLTTVTLLELTEERLAHKPELFVDLGCGRGVTCLTASCLGISSLGLELEPAWVEAAKQVATALKLPAQFVKGDFLDAKWPAEAVYFTVGTTYPMEMREEIAARLLAAKPKAVICGDWELPQNDFESLWSGSLPVDWGVARFTLCRPRGAVRCSWPGDTRPG